jgi:short subunit dehydrogenase-like uncharacterized protein
MPSSSLIAIYGAYGHTGRLVATELRDRGRDLVLAGRDHGALESLAAELDAPGHVRIHPAAVDDPAALRALTENAGVLVHCAGPFSRTGAMVADAAAGAGCHYIDHALESHHVKHVFDACAATAQRTGAVMIPGLSFYGGFGDLLASATAEGLSGIDRIVVAYAVSGWKLTTGAKDTAAQLFAETQRITYSDGALHIGYVEPRNAVFPFPPPLGPRSMIAPLPSYETMTIPRHTPVRNVDLMLTAATFEEPGMFDSEQLDTETRAASDFTVVAQAITGGTGVQGRLSGRDLWRAAAVASAEAAVDLADGQSPAKPGVLSPAEALPARAFLRHLEALGVFTADLPPAHPR